MSNLGNIDVQNTDTSRAGDMGYSLMADGPTQFKVTKFSVVPNNNDSNYSNIAAEYTSVDETNPGKILEWIVLTNSSKDAVEIGKARIAALAKSIGITENVTDTAQILNKHCAIDVAKKARDNDPTKINNVVKRYLEHSEWVGGMPERPVDSPVPKTQPAPSMNAAPASTEGKEVWES
jgi:hypothetical protein